MIRPLSTRRCLTHQELSNCLAAPLADQDVAEEHLSSCEKCRETLCELAGESRWWDSAAQTLSTPSDPAAARIAHSVCALQTDSSTDVTAVTTEQELKQLRELLQPASHPELLGRVGRYEVEQLVGRGGMGLVFRGRDTELHRIVAIKTISTNLLSLGIARQRFVREARASAGLSHPHVVAVYDVITEGPVPAIVMQYVAGSTLQNWLDEHGAIEWRDVIQLGIQLCDALTAAHEHGLIHRDIKPGNVLLEADGSRALLGDFGLVRALGDASLTRTGTLTGTPDYMSPEQANGQEMDQRSDLFSLGCLLYTMLAGRPPFQSTEPMATLNRLCHHPHPSIRSLQPGVPVELCRFVDRLLAKQPKRRYGSAAEAGAVLQRLATAPLRLTRESSRMRKMMSFAIAVSIILSVAGLALWKPLQQWRDAQISSAEKDSQLQDYTESRKQSASPYPEPNYSASQRSVSGNFAGMHRFDSRISELARQAEQIRASNTSLPRDWLDGSDAPLKDIDSVLEQLDGLTNRLEHDIRQ